MQVAPSDCDATVPAALHDHGWVSTFCIVSGNFVHDVEGTCKHLERSLRYASISGMYAARQAVVLLRLSMNAKHDPQQRSRRRPFHMREVEVVELHAQLRTPRPRWLD